jgi:acyl-CoA reductase-like NAD-dependent aldehyde dehydrogenase
MMADSVKIISPVDGSVYAERRYTSDTALDAAISRAVAAQAGWALVPVAERAKQVLAFLDALLAMNDEIVPELAWQMGRPIRFGGEKGGLEERARYMASIAEESLAPFFPEEKPGFRRYIKHEPLGLVLVVAPWNYP